MDVGKVPVNIINYLIITTEKIIKCNLCNSEFLRKDTSLYFSLLLLSTRTFVIWKKQHV